MENRFKVGDVITLKNAPGSKLRIIFIDGMATPYRCEVLNVGASCDLLRAFPNRVWVSDREVEPFVGPKKNKRPQPDEVVVIKRFGDRTEAHYSKTANTVTIKRYKDDPHNMHKACIYALDKLFDDDINTTINPRFYTGVVVCTECAHNKDNVGKLFTVKNGTILGCVYMTRQAKTFDDLNSFTSGWKFMEVHL